MPEQSYDVYVSYPKADEPVVEILVSRLERVGLTVWSSRKLLPGMIWVVETEKALANSKVCLVVVGESGLGKGQTDEVNSLIAERVKQLKDEYPIIPVLLPGAGQTGLPSFLALRQWIQFRQSLDEKDEFDRLVSAIKHYLGRQGRTERAENEPEKERKIPRSPSALMLGHVLNMPNLKGRLRSDEVRALELVGTYCVTRDENVSSTLMLGAILTQARNGGEKDAGRFFLEALGKQRGMRPEQVSSIIPAEFLKLDSEYLNYLESSPYPEPRGREAFLTEELIATLSIASTIAKDTKSKQIFTRHILGAILSAGLQTILNDEGVALEVPNAPDPALSALVNLKRSGFNLDELRRDFVRFVRVREENKNFSQHVTIYTGWLKHLRVAPPESLLGNLSARNLTIVSLGNTNRKVLREFEEKSEVVCEVGPGVRAGDFVLVYLPDPSVSRISPLSPARQVGRYLFRVSDNTPASMSAPGQPRRYTLNNKIVLEFPLTDTPIVNDALKKLSLFGEDFDFAKWIKKIVSKPLAEILWTTILTLNPEQVETLEGILQNTKQSPVKEESAAEGEEQEAAREGRDEAGANGRPSAQAGQSEGEHIRVIRRCPLCKRTYADEDLIFCPEDGSVLESSPAPQPHEEVTPNGEAHNTVTEESRNKAVGTTEDTVLDYESEAETAPAELPTKKRGRGARREQVETGDLAGASHPLTPVGEPIQPFAPPPLPILPPHESEQSAVIQNYITKNTFELSVKPPPPARNKVSIHVWADKVTLWHGGQPYDSPNLIGEDPLPEESPEDYGELLFKGIINGNGATSTLRGYEKARADCPGNLSFELWFDAQDAKLNSHKWEYIRDPGDNSLPLCVREQMTFYRRTHSAVKQAAPASPLKILIAICNPTTLHREVDDQGKKVNENVSVLVKLDVSQEREIIKMALDRLEAAGVVEYEVLDSSQGDPVTLDAISEKIQEGFHVLHLLSHGIFIRGSYYLVMENKDRGDKLERAEQFKKILGGHNLRLVVLAACQSATRGTGAALQGLGQSIVSEKIPSVIAMQDEVKVETAQLFTQYFYDDLARTGQVDQAMAATRFALYRHNDKEWQWGIPALFMSTDDGKLLEVDEAKAAAQLPILDQPEIKTYDQLPGQGNPAPQKMAQAIESAARRYGAVPEVVGALRAVVAPSLAAARGAEEEPLARPQDRAALAYKLSGRVQLDALKLKQYVEEQGSKLKLSLSVYRQIASALNAGKHVILIGPPGTGKTSLAHDICRYAEELKCAAGFIPTTATADWTAFDTIGGYVPTAQQVLQFRPGIFLQAICSGSWLVIDEINRAEIDKAFGELFTVLSGQRADLPYTVGRNQVRVLSADPKNWNPQNGNGLSGYDYVMHPTWRILATMNVYDKSSLFAMSFAFMRRFAFVDVDLPDDAAFNALIERWSASSKLKVGENDIKEMREKLRGMLQTNSPLKCRALGPAIVKDMIQYIGDRLQFEEEAKPLELLGEAFLLYVTPQLDGLDRATITAVYTHLQEQVFSETEVITSLQSRIRSLYPHIVSSEWESGTTSIV